jgi:geranylgeranyl pyrophosphate synthase
MSELEWPSSSEVHAAVGQRAHLLLDATGGLVADVGRLALGAHHGLLSDEPHSLITVLVPGACVAAGGAWRTSLWPAVAAELMMAAADVLDDAADADPAGDAWPYGSGVLLTAGAGLLSLASAAVVRVVEDGPSHAAAACLAQLLGEGFANAANGQARSLAPRSTPVDPLSAYHEAAAKSGPLGSLIAQLGARTATDNPEVLGFLGDFGRRLAIRSQLLNDARDASPDADNRKADVRAGAHTVPLAFVASRGAPPNLNDEALRQWEQRERQRIAAGGGIAAARALAEAERLKALQALDALTTLGCHVGGLRQLM